MSSRREVKDVLNKREMLLAFNVTMSELENVIDKLGLNKPNRRQFTEAEIAQIKAYCLNKKRRAINQEAAEWLELAHYVPDNQNGKALFAALAKQAQNNPNTYLE